MVLLYLEALAAIALSLSILFEVEKEWRWSVTYHQRTALDWLGNFDSSRDEIERILRNVYGKDTILWVRRWRWFFLATAGLFGYAGGSECGVSHYRMRAASGYPGRLTAWRFGGCCFSRAFEATISGAVPPRVFRAAIIRLNHDRVSPAKTPCRQWVRVV
jgi:hypothetical protein